MAVHGLAKVIGKLRSFRVNTRCLLLNTEKRTYAHSGKVPNLDEPITYSNTKASKMSTEDTLKLKPNPAVLPLEKYIVVLTTIVCLIYFTMLRKENKIDKILDGSFSYEEDDEIKILNALLHAKLKGLKTDDLERKLAEIRRRI